MKKFITSLPGHLVLALAAGLLFLVIKIAILKQPFVISNKQQYFWDLERDRGWHVAPFQLSEYYDFGAALFWSLAFFGLAKLKFLERHRLIHLATLNFGALAVGIFCSFYLQALLFGLAAYLLFIITYLVVIFAWEVLILLDDLFSSN